MKVVSIVNYKVKAGCSDEFIAAFDAPGGISPYANIQKLIQISETAFLSFCEVDDVDKAVEKEDSGINWLDRFEHLLEKYEDGSRTDSFSGLVVHEFEKKN